jgi:hypothetical protein
LQLHSKRSHQDTKSWPILASCGQLMSWPPPIEISPSKPSWRKSPGRPSFKKVIQTVPNNLWIIWKNSVSLNIVELPCRSEICCEHLSTINKEVTKIAVGAARGLVLAVPWVWQNSPLPSPRAWHELIGSGLRSKDSSAGCAPRCCTCDVTSVKHILWRSRDSHKLPKSTEETYLIVRKLSGSDKADNVNECFARKGTVSHELQHVAAHFPTWLVLCHCVLQFVERLYRTFVVCAQASGHPNLRASAEVSCSLWKFSHPVVSNVSRIKHGQARPVH